MGATRLGVAVIGPGRAGTVIARALQRAGHRIVAVAARGPQSHDRAMDLLDGGQPGTPEQCAERGDLVLVGVGDDDLPGMVERLVRAGCLRPGQYLAHLSGRYGIGVLDPAAGTGVSCLALHPVMTLTGASVDLDRLTGAAFGVTSLPEHRPVAEALVVEMGGEPVWVAEESRPAYHAALTLAANHAATLARTGAALLADAGVADPVLLLGPLVRVSIDNALRSGPVAMTGPVPRADTDTLAGHLAVWAEQGSAALSAYRAVALLAAVQARAAGLLGVAEYDRVLDALRAPAPAAGAAG